MHIEYAQCLCKNTNLRYDRSLPLILSKILYRITIAMSICSINTAIGLKSFHCLVSTVMNCGFRRKGSCASQQTETTHTHICIHRKASEKLTQTQQKQNQPAAHIRNTVQSIFLNASAAMSPSSLVCTIVHNMHGTVQTYYTNPIFTLSCAGVGILHREAHTCYLA